MPERGNKINAKGQGDGGSSDSYDWVKSVLDFRGHRDVYTVNLAPLEEIGRRPPLGAYVSNLWQRREFISRQSKAKAFGSIKNTLLGRIWLILDPFLSAGIYFFIFAVLLSFDRDIDNFVAYLVTGIILFTYLTKQFGSAASIIATNQNFIRAFAFPRASLVFSFSLRNFIDFLPSLVALLAFIWVIPPHAPPTTNWLLFPILFLITAIFGMGLSFITATWTTLFPDLKFVWPLITRFWFYGSGVFWSIDMFADKPVLQDVMMLNPGWVFLHLSRETLVYNRSGSMFNWGYYLGWAVVTFLLGFLLFWLNEERFAENLDG